MRITSLELTNIRQFRQKTIPFVPGFNLLVGENGAGKSTSLRSIATALGAVANFDPKLRLGESDIPYHAPECRVRLEYQIGGEPGWSEVTRRFRRVQRRGNKPAIPAIWFGANESLIRPFYAKKTRKLRGSRTRPYDDREGLRFREEMLFEEEFMLREYDEEKESFGRPNVVRRIVGEILRQFSDKFDRFTWTFVPYDCQVEIIDPENTQADQYKDFVRAAEFEVMRRFNSEKFEHPRRGWAQQRTLIFDGRGEPKASDKRIRPFFELRDVLEGVAKELKIQVPWERVRVELSLSPRIIVFGPDGPFRLEQLSDGEKRIFSFVVDIGRRLTLQRRNWDEVRKVPGIVLIDEIDCHLHPRWQRTIVKALQDLFPACQIIATTHSPFVIQGTNPDALHALDGPPPSTDFTDRGIEDIAFNVMHVKDPAVSKRYLEMLKVAKEYYTLLDEGKKSTAAKRKELAARLEALSSPYKQNPAFQAFLEMKREAALGSLH